MVGQQASPGDDTPTRLAAIVGRSRIGIDPLTGLATDFLNQYNEVVMLLDLVADDPAMVDEIAGWRPTGYAAHFLASGFAESALILEAYALSPPATRARFERLNANLADLLREGVAFLAQCRAAGASSTAQAAAVGLGADVRAGLDAIDALIHAGRGRPPQSTVDTLFAAARR